jgi:hypothetical protein
MRIFLRALVEIIHDTRKDKVMTLEQLVIRNLAVLEQAPTIAEKIDETVMRAVDARVGNGRAVARNGGSRPTYRKIRRWLMNISVTLVLTIYQFSVMTG